MDSAIFELSELKETRSVRPEAITRAEAQLEQALAAVGSSSEASRLSRLYWWTAEYGLVGTPTDYRLYGAGLLSSLWESHSCHDPAVRKLPLSASCAEQGYDITRTQPQLFVARDFEQLFSVLDEVEASLVHRVGGEVALEAALRSQEVATLHFGRDRFVTGQLSAVSGSATGGVLTLQGRVGLGADGRVLELFDAPAPGYRLPLGRLEDGSVLAAFGALGTRLSLRFASGVALEGELAATSFDRSGRPLLARIRNYRLWSERAGFSEAGAEYLLLVAPELVTAHAGASDAAYFPDSESSQLSVPKARAPHERELALLALYERAISAFRAQLGSGALPVFSAIHAELSRAFPDEWLLRWNLLECLCKLAEPPNRPVALARTLEQELLALELKFSHREPIASGLRYLSSLAA